MNPTPPSNDPHPAALDPEQLLRTCRAEHSRASGPGGQHRNKVQTAVTLSHEPTGVTASASERRSQAENHRVALFRLRVNLALQVRRPASPHEPVSGLWRSRTQGKRLAINPEHRDYPALLAEALDMLAHTAMDAPRAADALGVSPSQLFKLLRHEPRAMAMLNRARADRGDHPIK